MKLVLKRILFYVVSLTWGGVMSIIGLIATLILLPFGKQYIFHGRIYTVIGKHWGGVSLGCFFLCDDTAGEHTWAHESGHGLQNCLWGPLFPFVIAIPSAVRYWYRNLKYNRKGILCPTVYDDIWFEGQATKWGKEYVLTDRI